MSYISFRLRGLRRFVSPSVPLILLSVTLTGCAGTLPAPEAAAFKKIAAADRDILSELSKAQLKAKISYASRAMYQNIGRVVVNNGCGPAVADDCTVTYSVRENAEISLREPIPNARALMGSIARYGEQMAELAEADDIETIKSKAESAGGAVKSLALAAGPAGAIVSPIIDIFVFAGNASLVEKRRRALLVNAQAAQPAIKDATAQLDRMLTPLMRGIILDASRQVGDINQRIATSQIEGRKLASIRRPSAKVLQRISALKTQRVKDLTELVEASRKLNSASAVKLEFKLLSDAHLKIIEKLQNPDISAEDAMRDLNQVLVLFDTLRDAI